ncbi:hypothetical protein ACH5A3_12685 [Streptomyces echinatus]
MPVSGAVGIGAAVLAVVVVVRLTRMRERTVLSGEPPAPFHG